MKITECANKKTEQSLSPFFALLRVLLAVTAIYILLTTVAVDARESFFTPNFIHFYYYFSLLLISFLACVSLRDLRYVRPAFYLRRKPRKFFLSEFLCSLIPIVVWFVYRKPILLKYPIWNDEYTQFSTHWDGARVIQFAAFQQQPPIDYYFSAFARTYLGISEFSVLIHAMVFGVASYVLFYLFLRKIKFPIALLLIPMLLFACNGVLLEFSAEARPVSVAIFAALLVLGFVWESVNGSTIKKAPLVGSSLLLLYTIGLQPIFFITLLPLSFAPLFLSERKRFLKLQLFSWVLPLLLFIPEIWLLYKKSDETQQFYPGSHFTRWLNQIFFLRLNDFRHFWQTFSGAIWMLYLPVAIFAVSLFFRFFRKNKEIPDYGKLAAVAILFGLSFLILFRVCWIIINWPLAAHYFALWILGVIALGAVCVTAVSEKIAGSLGGVRRKVYPALLGVAALILGFSLSVGFIPKQARRIHNKRSSFADWRKIRNEILPLGSALPILVAEIPYGPVQSSPFNVGPATLYFRNDSEINAISLYGFEKKQRLFTTFHLLPPLKKFQGVESNIVYLFNRLYSYEEIPFSVIMDIFSDAQVVDVGNSYTVLIYKNVKDPIDFTYKTFEKILPIKPNHPYNFHILDALLAEDIRNGRKAEALKHLRKLKSINIPHQEGGRLFAHGETPLIRDVKKYLFELADKIQNLPPQRTLEGAFRNSSKNDLVTEIP